MLPLILLLTLGFRHRPALVANRDVKRDYHNQ